MPLTNAVSYPAALLRASLCADASQEKEYTLRKPLDMSDPASYNVVKQEDIAYKHYGDQVRAGEQGGKGERGGGEKVPEWVRVGEDSEYRRDTAGPGMVGLVRVSEGRIRKPEAGRGWMWMWVLSGREQGTRAKEN